MNLFETLKQLKNIQPDQAFSENSRRDILTVAPKEVFSPRLIFARFVGVAGSLALAGALIFIIAGGLSATDLAPKFSSIDPSALRAEAQAIDMQINLLNINYAESSLPAAPTPTAGASHLLTVSNSASVSSTPSMASSTPTSTISIDEILQGLSQ